MANIHRKKGKRPLKVHDLMPHLPKPKRTDKQVFGQFMSWAQQLGVKVPKRDA